MNKRIVILGAGISGLATAYWLMKEGLDVVVLEKAPDVGGAMNSRNENGYMVDYGPNSGLETTPLIRKLVEETGIIDQMIYANQEGNKRYILRDGELHALPMNPPAFLKTKLFSAKAKLRLFAEPFIGRSEDGYYQSISDFVKRRLGQEFLDYAINPFVAGVYAGNPDELSVKSAFPKLYRLEEEYGGLIKGTIKGARERKKRNEESKQSAKMFSFKDGMQTFPKAISEKLGSDRIILNAEIKKISKSGSCYVIHYTQNGNTKVLESEIIISALPAYSACYAFKDFDDKLYSHLKSLYYPPVKVLFLGYEKKAIGRALDGFGFLIPEKEKRSFLGAIWSSVIFNNRAPEGHAAFTLFVGGARSPELFDSPEKELYNKVIGEFHKIMNISEDPVFRAERMWTKAIPQYNIGYIEHERYFDEFEKANKGILLSGNFRGGIAVGDCIKSSEIVYKKALDLL
ncbi:MAG: protoporphyrinogen oxidase [Bacteroidota bacterium]|nr:protoporphyrinogen oxidase [Bacteroidota bacterium]MDP4190098.1 protoporphyrinogen oxidase [Bacteroidota bacterium]MDP4193713.1 protoporphyrinogen oxidase [Bacteroidota bacterium]